MNRNFVIVLMYLLINIVYCANAIFYTTEYVNYVAQNLSEKINHLEASLSKQLQPLVYVMDNWNASQFTSYETSTSVAEAAFILRKADKLKISKTECRNAEPREIYKVMSNISLPWYCVIRNMKATYVVYEIREYQKLIASLRETKMDVEQCRTWKYAIQGSLCLKLTERRLNKLVKFSVMPFISKTYFTVIEKLEKAMGDCGGDDKFMTKIINYRDSVQKCKQLVERYTTK